MSIPFTKMQGTGNDFVLLDNMDGRLTIGPSWVRSMGDRRRGIGFDQLLVAEPAPGPKAEITMRVYNKDGSCATHCGNGLRCFAVYVRGRGLVESEVLEVAVGDRILRTRIHGAWDEAGSTWVSVDMGPPAFEPSAVPLVASGMAPRYPLDIDPSVTIGAVSMGNPHAVLEVADVDTAPVHELSPAIQASVQFPAGVNVGFMQRVDAGRIRLRVFERGAGETLACGTGACAAVAVGRRWGILDERVAVGLSGGELEVSWPGEGESLLLGGPAVHVFDGFVADDDASVLSRSREESLPSP